MAEISLDAQLRKELRRSKVRALREKGFIPAVIYAQGKETLPIKVSQKELFRLIHEHRIETTVINLKLKADLEEKVSSCLIKEIQRDPIQDNIIHVDFNEISLTKTIKVGVPVVAKGEPVGVKQEGGSLEHLLWEIEVECLPADIPRVFEVEVSHLKIGEAIHIKDIAFPSGVKVLNNPEAIVLSVAAPMKEEVAPVEGEEKQEPEVIKEKKEVPAEGEGKEGEAKKEK